jgi:hypothetical protein
MRGCCRRDAQAYSALQRAAVRPVLSGRNEKWFEALVFPAMYGAGASAAAAYNIPVNLTKYFKGLAKVTKTFSLEVGPLRATGVPAVLVAVTGVVLAAGVSRALMQSSDRLPETLREARSLAQAMRPEVPKLSS